MAGRISLVEQKRLQWAKEREEMARLCGHWNSHKLNNPVRTTIRTYPCANTRMSMTELNEKHQTSSTLRKGDHSGSMISLKSMGSDSFGSNSMTMPRFDCGGGSLINLNEHIEMSQLARRRSPSLPPIFHKDQQQYTTQEQRELGVEGSRYCPQPQNRLYQHHHHHHNHHGCQHSGEHMAEQRHTYGSPREEREGETSGYASDSVEAPLPPHRGLLPGCKAPGTEIPEGMWQNQKNYHGTPDSSLPPSRRLSASKGGELNRQRWGSIWGQDVARSDPPPPSWLERGLSRLDHTSQVLVINHDSASSPDSSTTGSAGSESNKTYLRGQNIPVNADELQEREAKRQKALELQNAIKQQLEERDRQRKEERNRRIREEREEEERIKRERDKEKARFEEEQRRLKEKEDAKQKKSEAMREVLEAAERLAKEEKRQRRKHENVARDDRGAGDSCKNTSVNDRETTDNRLDLEDLPLSARSNIAKTSHCRDNCDESPKRVSGGKENEISREREKTPRDPKSDANTIQLPVGRDVAIVLSARLDDPEMMKNGNVQLVNLVVASPRSSTSPRSNLNLTAGLGTLVQSMTSPIIGRRSKKLSPRIVENRLLTPSKYRASSGRDFGTQTDVDQDSSQSSGSVQEVSMKERKEAMNANRRDVEKSTNTGPTEEMKTLPRSKSQPRTTLDSRPRWNANRPGTRYRTQSEKDPHYQRRLRLRRRRVETSDEGSRSPSPDRAKLNNSKSKARSSTRRKVKPESYDADLSMDSLNSVVPLRIDKNGRINVEIGKDDRSKIEFQRGSDNNDDEKRQSAKEGDENVDAWCGREILSQLTNLRNGLMMKQKEWDPRACLISPTPGFY